jgi:hypothetical protein
MDGHALISLISSVILGLLFIYAIVCAARIYTADRRERLGEDQRRHGWLDWCPGLARRLALGTVVLLTILALAVTAASWSMGTRPLRALLHRLEGIGAARARAALRPASASTAAPAAPVTGVQRPEPIFVWNGRVMEAPKPARRLQAPQAPQTPRPERRSVEPARARDQSAGLAPERERMMLAMRDEKPARVEQVASRVERLSRPNRAARVERPERVVRVERAERPPKPERSSRAERPERVTRHGR